MAVSLKCRHIISAAFKLQQNIANYKLKQDIQMKPLGYQNIILKFMSIRSISNCCLFTSSVFSQRAHFLTLALTPSCLFLCLQGVTDIQRTSFFDLARLSSCLSSSSYLYPPQPFSHDNKHAIIFQMRLRRFGYFEHFDTLPPNTVPKRCIASMNEIPFGNLISPTYCLLTLCY